MASKMVFVCSCGNTYDIGDFSTAETHLDDNPTHTLTEGYAHSSGTGVPQTLPVEAGDGTVYRVTVDASGGMSSWSDAGQATKLPKSRMSASTDPDVDSDASEGYEAGSRWLNTTSGEEFVCFDPANGAAVWGSTTQSSGGAGVWGSDAAFAESLPVSVTTSTSESKKVLLEVTASASGTYRIGWSYGWNYDATSYDFRGHLYLDDSELWEHCQEPKDSGGSSWEKTGTDQKHRTGGHRYVDLTAGSHTFLLTWHSSSNGNEASIWDAVLEFWRHS